MQQASPSLVQIITRYDAPLQRYARRMVKKPLVASIIVKEVFEQVYELNAFKADEQVLRTMFKSHTRELAATWLKAGEREDNRQQTTDDGQWTVNELLKPTYKP
jgi:DNA-directed RNA polymerase specialized sigma24 family protein